MNIFDHYRQRYEAAKDEEFTLQEFLTICRQDRSAYANAAERLLMAIGEPVMVDTALESRLSRLFSNRVIARYPAFEEFYGMEEAIEQIVSYLKHAAQGLEEKKQILYLLGPVGGGKSSLAERLKALMQRVPIYTLSANGERSPVNDHPLCLFNPQEDASILEKEFNIPSRYLGTIMSPWAAKRLHEFGGDITKFKVVKVRPSILEQIAIAKTEPGDENNQDISALVGKVDIRKTGEPRAERSGRLRLLWRPVPRQPGDNGIRRDVQSADQGAASAADRDPGRQLQRHRRHLRPAVQRHYSGALQRIRMGDLP
jgi:Putative Ser protein kinase